MKILSNYDESTDTIILRNENNVKSVLKFDNSGTPVVDNVDFYCVVELFEQEYQNCDDVYNFVRL